MRGLNLAELNLVHGPAKWRTEHGTIHLVTAPGTDLWQRTYYHFRNDNAPLLLWALTEQYFSLTFKASGKGRARRFDQVGLALYLDSENWLKASAEYDDGVNQHLGSVVTNGGFSDWATQNQSAEVSDLYFRLSRRADDFKLEFSLDGREFQQLRICHLAAAIGTVYAGPYACSPEDGSFEAVFSEFALGPCLWAAHDGQQPDY